METRTSCNKESCQSSIALGNARLQALTLAQSAQRTATRVFAECRGNWRNHLEDSLQRLKSMQLTARELERSGT